MSRLYLILQLGQYAWTNLLLSVSFLVADLPALVSTLTTGFRFAYSMFGATHGRHMPAASSKESPTVDVIQLQDSMHESGLRFMEYTPSTGDDRPITSSDMSDRMTSTFLSSLWFTDSIVYLTFSSEATTTRNVQSEGFYLCQWQLAHVMNLENSEDEENVLNRSDEITSGSSTKEHREKPQPPPSLLSVPQKQLSRRPSLDSALSGSDISELSFVSTELGSVHQEGLIRTLSNVSSNLVSIPPPSKWRSRLQELWVANYGAFLVLISQMFGCMMNIATRLLEAPGPHGVPMHPFQILFVRQLITVLITSTYALWSKSVPHFPLGPPGKVRLLLVTRGICGFFGVFGMYFSLVYLPINEATILTFLAPIGAGYTFSLLIPGETFTRQQQLAGFISLIGVVFIARPASLFTGGGADSSPGPPDIEVSPPVNGTYSAAEPDAIHPTSAQHLQAVGVAMIGVLGAIGAITAIRAIGTRAHALLSVNYFSFWCTIVSLGALVVFPSVQFRLPGNMTEWGLLSLLGCCGFTMQLLLTKGLAYGSSSGSSKTGSRGAAVDLEMQDRGTIPMQQDGPPAPPTITPGPLLEGPSHASTQSNQHQQIKGSGAKATSMLYAQMLFALIADKIIFGVTPGVSSWIGSGFILFGAIWVAADRGKKLGAGAGVVREDDVVVPRNGAGVAQEEEGVGLLDDVDDRDGELDVAHERRELELGNPTSSGTRGVG